MTFVEEDPCRLVRINLYCSSLFEQLASRALRLYAEKLGNSPEERLTRTVLLFIAIESEKHAEQLGLLSRFYGKGEELADCEQLVGEPWRAVQNLLESFSRGEFISLSEFLKRQMWLERAVGEETYHAALMSLLAKSWKFGCIEERISEVFEHLLMKIVQDEKWHEEILNRIAKKNVP